MEERDNTRMELLGRLMIVEPLEGTSQAERRAK
jgi:hypothetical protein